MQSLELYAGGTGGQSDAEAQLPVAAQLHPPRSVVVVVEVVELVEAVELLAPLVPGGSSLFSTLTAVEASM